MTTIFKCWETEKNFQTFKSGWSVSSITNFMTWFSRTTWALLKVTGTHGLMVNVVRAPLGSALLWLKIHYALALKSYRLKLSCVHNFCHHNIETLTIPVHWRIDFVGWFLCVLMTGALTQPQTGWVWGCRTKALFCPCRLAAGSLEHTETDREQNKNLMWLHLYTVLQVSLLQIQFSSHNKRIITDDQPQDSFM